MLKEMLNEISRNEDNFKNENFKIKSFFRFRLFLCIFFRTDPLKL